MFIMGYYIPPAQQQPLFSSNFSDAKVLKRPNMCYIFHKQGVQEFKILNWLSSCEDKDKDKEKDKDTILGLNIFQG